MTLESSIQANHEELVIKLPWLINGTLDESEAAELREHAAQCEYCQNEMASLTLMQNAIKQAPYEPLDAAASFKAMRKRIALESTATKPSVLSRLRAYVEQFVEKSAAPQWAFASVAGVLLAVLVMQHYPWAANTGDDDYRVLSGDENTGAISMSIRFDQQLSDAHSEAILDSLVKQMALEPQWVKTGPNNYQLSVNPTSDESSVTPAMLSNIIETATNMPGVEAAGITP